MLEQKRFESHLFVCTSYKLEHKSLHLLRVMQSALTDSAPAWEKVAEKTSKQSFSKS